LSSKGRINDLVIMKETRAQGITRCDILDVERFLPTPALLAAASPWQAGLAAAGRLGI